MNWTRAATSSSIARWADAARKPWPSCSSRDSRKCTTLRAGSRRGQIAWIRRYQSTEAVFSVVRVRGERATAPFSFFLCDDCSIGSRWYKDREKKVKVRGGGSVLRTQN